MQIFFLFLFIPLSRCFFVAFCERSCLRFCLATSIFYWDAALGCLCFHPASFYHVNALQMVTETFGFAVG